VVVTSGATSHGRSDKQEHVAQLELAWFDVLDLTLSATFPWCCTCRSLRFLSYPLEDVSSLPVASPGEQLRIAVHLLQQVSKIWHMF